MKLRQPSSILFLTFALAASSCTTEPASDAVDTTAPVAVEATDTEESTGSFFAAEPTTTVAASSDAPPSADVLPARLALVDVGDVEGATIVLAGQVPDGATWSGSMSQRMDTTINDLPGPAQPVFGMGMTVSVQQVDDGLWRHSGGYTSVDLVDANGTDPQDVEVALQVLQAMTGVTYTADVDQFGVAIDSSFDGLDQLDAGLLEFIEPTIEQVENLTVPVPTEPLGVGATWSDTISFEARGITTTANVTYVLTEIDGDRYTLEVTQEQNQIGAGIVSSTGTFTGTIEGDVTEPLPLRSIVSGQTDMVALGAGGQRVRVVLTLEAILEGS